MVYRTEKYQKLKAEVEKQSKKCKFRNVWTPLYTALSTGIEHCQLHVVPEGQTEVVTLIYFNLMQLKHYTCSLAEYELKFI